MKTCKKCGQRTASCDKVGGQFFVLCHSQPCSGTASVGSPLSNGKSTEAEAWAQARAEKSITE